ncbi:MAG: MFS transporter [Pseudomonadota bacterium]
MFERRPTGLQAFPGGAGEPIARLNALEGLARSMLVGIIPLLALEALETKEMVTRAYLFASVLTLFITLNFAPLERWLKRRWVLSLGVGFILSAMLLFVFGSGMSIALAIGLQTAAASLFAVCISLYIMDYIGKKQLIYTESRRLMYTGIAWIIGPSLGLWLWENTTQWAPFLMTALGATVMLLYFWYLRLGHSEVIRPARKKPARLRQVIPRFFSQPAMRVSYCIVLSRAIFWVALFIYGPIYVVEADMPKWVAGGLLSMVSALLLASPVIRGFASRFGTRTIIIYALNLTALSILCLYLIGEPKPIGLLFWITASLGGVTVDVLGNIPFMRLVKPRERTEMTTIYSTWRDASYLLTPLLVSLVLLVAAFEVFYLLLAAVLCGASCAASYLPRRL